MEEKQLDFNAPLLSVRRFSSTAVSSQGKETQKTENAQGNKHYVPPDYISELKSGPMRNSGAVPFRWEQIPGRRKDGEGSHDRSTERRPLVAPKLPPGRTSEVRPKSWDKEFEEKTTIRPQKDYGVVFHQNVSPMNDNVPKLESSRVGTKTKKESDSEDGDDVYADALDTLSRTESSFFNCSVSGISGLDDMNVKRSGASSTDRQTRDFMMDRFLPAAKAMASGTPQHSSWRQPIPREQPIMAKKVVDANRRPPVYHYRGNIPQYVEETVDDESEDEDDDYGDNGNSSAKACGLLPKFCLKNSFCLLNPVPGVKIRSRAPYPSSVRTFSTHVKPACNGSYIATDNENNWEAVYKHKLINGPQPLDAESKMTSESNQLTLWSDSQTPDGSSSRMNSGGGGISPFRSDAIQSPFQEGMGFLGIPKQVKSIETNISTPRKDSKWGSRSPSTMVEKTLYVDSGNMLTSISKLSSSDTCGMIDCREESGILTGCRKVNDLPCAVSFPEDVNNFTISLEEFSKSNMSEAVSSNLWSSPGSLNPVKDVDRMECFRKGDVHDQEIRAMMSSKVRANGNLEFVKPESLNEVDPGNSIVCSIQLPLPPPLPKSPSESWLWRTLPSISSKNGASFHPRKQPLKTTSNDPKWETIVKTSHGHHGHLRFSEELTKPLPQQSET